MIKYSELKDYLYSKYCFGFTATIRKKVIIYSYRRYILSMGMVNLKVKVDRRTKDVISVLHNGTEYTSFDDVKKIIEK